MGGQGASALRRANTGVVVEQLRRSGATSRASLARRTVLAKQTVSTPKPPSTSEAKKK